MNTLLSLIAAITLASAQTDLSVGPQAGRDMTVWREFVELVQSQSFPADRIRPYQEGLRDANLRVLALMGQQAHWAEWSRPPEVFHVGNQVHYVLPLTFDEGPATYTFSFVLDGDRWFFQHVESIQLRLDRLGPMPVSAFPDLPEDTKAWMRAENDATRDVWLYNTLAAEKGPDTALKWFLDGAGYALAARAWVPFVSPGRAFILYACWEQANLRGNRVTLEVLSTDEAVIRMIPLWFRLYDVTAHLKQQISFEDYRRLFEVRWRDRAANAGWNVSFSYSGGEVVLSFTRRIGGESPEVRR